ncbi:VlmB-like protein [Plantactinospora sp. B6F1]|uniref:VlmB-like protein n=1 Tax=Plantactinospora sp. B6F1 TaxID=3158971 RepID=UPI00102B9E61
MTEIPSEVAWTTAPGVLEGARTLELSPEQCDLDYWLGAVAGGSLRGLVHGHAPDAAIPDFMRRPGPLRDAVVEEFAFQAIAEEKATRAIAALVPLTPDIACMEFYATQLLDEARHARTYRGHLLELGIPEAELPTLMEKVAGQDARKVLFPLETFGLGVLAKGDFYGGVVVLTVLVEGVIAPTTELSERKWQVLDPAAAQIQRGAGIDEIRHLTVGSTIVRRYVAEQPQQKDRLVELIVRGREMWQRLPLTKMLERHEALFQEGMLDRADVIGDYEIWPGRRLLDTTPDERIDAALRWSKETQDVRLTYMGLTEAI